MNLMALPYSLRKKNVQKMFFVFVFRHRFSNQISNFNWPRGPGFGRIGRPPWPIEIWNLKFDIDESSENGHEKPQFFAVNRQNFDIPVHRTSPRPSPEKRNERSVSKMKVQVMTMKTHTESSKSELSSRGKRPFKVFCFCTFFPQAVPIYILRYLFLYW